jgi:tRNA dimethylallyltransferase
MLVILGPTACGKTRLAVRLAQRLNGEIISADSRQVYRGMDIGTGKDLTEYVLDGEAIPYHLIDVVAAGDAYNVSRYQHDYNAALTDILGRNKLPILCGGTGFYIEAVLKNYEFTHLPINEPLREALATQTDDELRLLFQKLPSAYSPLADISTRKRLIRAIEIAQHLHSKLGLGWTHKNDSRIQSFNHSIYGLSLPVETRRAYITARLRERLQNGMVAEVTNLLNNGVAAEQLIFYGLEYKFLTQYVQGQLDYNTLFERLNVAIHQFAKRQMTYFRKMERDGFVIHWLDAQRPMADLVEEITTRELLRGTT